MQARGARRQSMTRVFAVYALVGAVVVVALGLLMARSYRAEARRRGVAEGASEALLIAQTAVEPILDGRPLNQPLTTAERHDLNRLVRGAVRSGDVLRLRLRDLAGRVVYSDDGSGFRARPEDETLAAARGATVARLTHLNTDAVDTGPVGPPAVEVYLPLVAGPARHRVGVLETYLPYAPIDADVSAGLHGLDEDLALGLGALYVALFAISISVTRRLRRQLRLNTYLAEHDTLTDLPNRTVFHDHARAAVAAAARHGVRVAIAIVDLDRFKEINDTLGHRNGDALLAELAVRLTDQLRPDDTVARLGGDEFGLVLRDCDDAGAALWRIRSTIEQEVLVNGLPLSVDSSIGFAVAVDDGDDVDELLQRAEVAMYAAKARHAGVLRYDPSQDLYDATNLALAAELRHAIDAGELVLHYQPKVRFADEHVEALEALVRWQHPTLGLLPPDRFVPLAEQSDLIDRLTEWVVHRALVDSCDLQVVTGLLPVAVNVSARNLGRPGLSDLVARELAASGYPAECLVIEMTETALLADPDGAARVLGELSALGVRISLDDFGSGQTSLGYVATLPIDELKIDRSFVTDLATSRAGAAIVQTIVDLGHHLGLRVVAEGVETPAGWEAAAATGCDLAQGFYLARPMPLAQVATWLTVHRARTSSTAIALSSVSPAGDPRGSTGRPG
jgi:diguanylate cyclase (GGDEF)-like protein